MRKPDSVCRVCLRAPTNPHFDDLCSSECATRLSQTEYYEIELGEAIAELNEFEEGVYLPLHLKLTRAEAQLRVLEAGVRSLSNSDHLAIGPHEHKEVREWKEAQSKDDAWAVSIAKRPIKRLRKKVRQLEEELRGIDQRWKTLADRKEKMLKKLSSARGDD